MISQEFLPKNPEKALHEVKEKLYGRLRFARLVRHSLDRYQSLVKDECKLIELKTEIFCINDEEKFLLRLLDIIERS